MPNSQEAKEKKRVGREIFLTNEEGMHRWLEEGTNGELWEGGEQIFVSEAEANKKGWKVDAVRIVFEYINENERQAKRI